jgi:hypothetical protein
MTDRRMVLSHSSVRLKVVGVSWLDRLGGKAVRASDRLSIHTSVCLSAVRPSVRASSPPARYELLLSMYGGPLSLKLSVKRCEG